MKILFGQFPIKMREEKGKKRFFLLQQTLCIDRGIGSAVWQSEGQRDGVKGRRVFFINKVLLLP